MKDKILGLALWLGAAASAYGQTPSQDMREVHENCAYSWGAGTPEYVDCMESFTQSLDEIYERQAQDRQQYENSQRNGFLEDLYDARRKQAIEDVVPDSSQCRIINDTVICQD